MDELLNPTPEQTNPSDAAAAALERVAAAAGPGFDKSQMDLLKAKLAKLGQPPVAEPTGEDVPPTPAQTAAEAVAAQANTRPLTGKDVDWSEYDVDFNLLHLYKKAVFRDTPQGPMDIDVQISDYRVVDNVKVPFSVRQVSSMATVVIRLTSVKHNVPVDDAIFKKPGL